jgi:hypothetical protein
MRTLQPVAEVYTEREFRSGAGASLAVTER